MGRGFHFPIDVGEGAGFVDDEGGAFDTHVFLAIHAFFFHYVIEAAYGFVFVGEKGEVEFMFVPEAAVFCGGVSADA